MKFIETTVENNEGTENQALICIDDISNFVSINDKTQISFKERQDGMYISTESYQTLKKKIQKALL